MDVYRLGKAAQAALDGASEVAAASGHGSVESGHLVAALLRAETAATTALRRAGYGAEGFAKALDAVYDGPRAKTRIRDLERSGELKEVLELARDEADTAGEHEIGPVRLFLAATQDDEWCAARALRHLGADVEKLRRAVESLARDEAQGTLPE